MTSFVLLSLCVLFVLLPQSAFTQLQISPLSGVQYDTTRAVLHTHLYVLTCDSPIDIYKGSGNFSVDKTNQFVPFPGPAVLYYEHQVDAGCAGYNIAFEYPLPSPPQVVSYNVWATNPYVSPGSSPIQTASIDLNVAVITLPLISTPMNSSHSSSPSAATAVNVSIFKDVAFTADGDTHVHVVIDVSPPRMDYVAFILALTCNQTVLASQFEPSQFEHYFDLLNGVYFSRYNVSWMLDNIVCNLLSYSLLVIDPLGNQGGVDHRLLTPTSIN